MEEHRIMKRIYGLRLVSEGEFINKYEYIHNGYSYLFNELMQFNPPKWQIYKELFNNVGTFVCFHMLTKIGYVPKSIEEVLEIVHHGKWGKALDGIGLNPSLTFQNKRCSFIWQEISI